MKRNAVAGVSQAPGAAVRGTGSLPFTGPGDIALALLLSLLAAAGGYLFLVHANGREELAHLNRRGMDSPSGFKLAYRELLKKQLHD